MKKVLTPRKVHKLLRELARAEGTNISAYCEARGVSKAIASRLVSKKPSMPTVATLQKLNISVV